MHAVLQAKANGPDLLIAKPVLLLGRHEECDVQLQSAKISRRHCVIAIVDDRLVIRDLGSTNGIRVNGVRHAEADLQHGDELAIGNFHYRVSIGEQSSDRPPRPPENLNVSSEMPVAIADDDGDPAPIAKKA